MNLYDQYRPTTFDQVLGQDRAVKQCRAIFQKSPVIVAAVYLYGSRINVSSVKNSSVRIVPNNTLKSKGAIMSKDKRERLIRRAIEEFFSIFPECQNTDFDCFIVTKFKRTYRVELYINGQSYLHLMTE